jgi:DNA modification methylase
MTEQTKACKPRAKKPQDLCGKRLMVGSCLERMKDLPDESIDSVVTDPPYELSFMGKGWDGSGIAYSVELWAECLRVLKPGGHLLAFGGTRTYHRMAVAIEDAGFEIRDSIQWVYGSGFPKSLDVSKAIDKQRHDRADIEKVVRWLEAKRKASGTSRQQVEDAFGTVNVGQAFFTITAGSTPRVPTLEQVPVLLELFDVAAGDVPEDIRRLLSDLNGKKGQPGENWAKREVTGQHEAHVFGAWVTNYGMEHHNTGKEKRDVPATDAAKQWQGWGTALKPAHEPIVLARKPLAGTVAATVLAHGTGALNIDGCRVGQEQRVNLPAANGKALTPSATTGASNGGEQGGFNYAPDATPTTAAGRWPANFILTHAAACHLLAAGHTTTEQKAGKVTDIRGGNYAQGVEAYKERKKLDRDVTSYKDTPAVWACAPDCPAALMDQQSNAEASRFFIQCDWDQAADAPPFLYQAKAGKKERNAGLNKLPAPDGIRSNAPRQNEAEKPAAKVNNHPTVKPLALIRYLQRLVTPLGGTTLDPFMGSGTSAAAAILEGFEWRGCEMTAEYLPIITARVKWATKEKRKEQPKLPLQD